MSVCPRLPAITFPRLGNHRLSLHSRWAPCACHSGGVKKDSGNLRRESSITVGTAVHLGVLIVEGLLGLFLAYAAYLNLSSAPMLMKQYTLLRLPRWYTLLAGVLLSTGVIALLVGLVSPAIGALATLWMVAYFVVATLTHVVRKDKLAAVATPLVFLALCVALAVLRWADLAPFFSALHIG